MPNFLERLTQRPALVRAGLAFLAKRGPVHTFMGTCVVLGYDQVRQVLGGTDEFHLADAMRRRIASGDFLLNSEPPGRYDTDKAQLCHAVYANQRLLAQVTRHSGTYAAALLGAQAKPCTYDAVGGLLEAVAADVVWKYFLGMRIPASPPPEFSAYSSTLAELIVTSNPDCSALRKRARQAAAAIHQLIDQRLTDLANGAPPGDDVVSAMAGCRLSPAVIRRNVAGLVATGIATIVRAGGQALNELLLRPSVLVMARDAACRGDRELVLQYVMEALRFNPMFHFIPRTCVRDTALHVADAPPVEIKAGQQLFVGLLAAMFDGAGFPEPEHFRTDRPLASYLHFGAGIHRCFGGPLAQVILREIFTALLQHAIARDHRAEGGGYPVYRWPALTHLWITL